MQKPSCSNRNEIFVLEPGRHTLITGPDGNTLINEKGEWLIFDSFDNKITSLLPTKEVMGFFKNSGFEIQSYTNLDEQKDYNEQHENEEEKDSANDYVEDDIQERTKSGSSKWCREAILLLINLYKENYNRFKSTTVKNEHVWGDIVERMHEAGYTYTKHQIEYKFKYLKARYIKKKDNIGARGTGESPLSFDYYKEFNEIFGNKPNVVPVALASSSSSSETPESGNEESNEKKRPSRLEKEITSLGNLLSERDEKREAARERRHQERQAASQQALTVYQTMMEKLLDKLKSSGQVENINSSRIIF